MSGYFFSSENKSVSDIAKENVQSYNDDRKKFIQEVIDQHIKAINSSILTESRKKGKTSITYNYTLNKVETTINDQMFKDIQFGSFTKEEHDFILESICKYLEKEKLTYIAPETVSGFVSQYYRANLVISWA